MRAAQIEGDRVVNVILVAEDGDPAAFGAVACGPEVGDGWIWDGEAFAPPPQETEPPVTPSGPPDRPTLGDWRVGLELWGRLGELLSRVAGLVADGHPLARVAQERLEYSNNVLRSDLLQLAPLFDFSEAEIDESLWRAHRVSLGDLTGIWPLPPPSD